MQLKTGAAMLLAAVSIAGGCQVDRQPMPASATMAVQGTRAGATANLNLPPGALAVWGKPAGVAAPQGVPITPAPSQPGKPGAAAAPGTPVGVAELQALYAAPHREDGVVLAGAHAGARWIKWTKPDGSIELSAAHGMFADTGKFVLKDDAVCASWAHIDNGRETCMHLFRTGPDSYTSITLDGNPGSRFSVRPSDRNTQQ